MVNSSAHLEDTSLKLVCCLVSLIIITKLQHVHEAKLIKLKGEMGKSRIIRGNFSTLRSVIAHIRKLNKGCPFSPN